MRSLYFKLLFLCTLFPCFQSIAQVTSCGTETANNYQQAQDPVYAASLRRQLQDWTAYTQQMANLPPSLVVNTPRGPVYEIPIVFHIIHTGQAIGTQQNPSDATIQSLVSYLNNVYAATWAANPDTNNGGVFVPIRFVLAQRTPGCAATTGINRVNGSSVPGYSAYGIAMAGASQGGAEADVKALSIWPNTAYMNIWIVTNIQGAAANGGAVAGYAYYPGASSSVDGVVLRCDQTNWAIAHELGHTLGLRHTFEGSSNATTCPSNSNCNTQGDLVCDTDPHPLVSGCPTGTNPCTNSSYVPVNYNIMNYSSCPNRFTQGQKNRMIFQLMNYRRSLVTSLGVLPPTAAHPTNYPAPVAACVTPAPASSNAFNIGPFNVDFANLSYGSAGWSVDGNYYLNHTINSCLEDQLFANVTVGSPSTLSVTTDPYNIETTAVWIDWNNDGVFSAAEQVLYGQPATAGVAVTASVTPPATAVLCTPLRMRVFSDYGSPSNPCAAPVYGQVEDFTVIVAPATTTTPTVSISAAPSGNICVATSVTFTATTANAISPAYQWKKNGLNVGTNATIYTNASWTNGDVVSLTMTSSVGCATSTVTTNSNNITMTVNAPVTPSVTVSGPSTACQGTTVQFTANPVNGGAAPSYQWYKNGSPVGTNQPTYSSNGLVTGDAITVAMTSNAACASPSVTTSTPITMTISPMVTPTAAISVSPGTSVCANTPVTFTLTTNVTGGTITWWKRTSAIGTNSATLNDTPVPLDYYSCIVTTPATGCYSGSGSVTSNVINMNVGTLVTPAVSISGPTGPICSGVNATFAAIPVNGGAAPSYQWKVNGANVGSNSVSYTSNTLANGDVLTIIMTSNAPCPATPTVNSAPTPLSVTPSVTPAVTITASPNDTVCAGTPVTFTAAPVNGGTAPAYAWLRNGVSAGSNSNTFVPATVGNGDIISLSMTSNVACATLPTAVNNLIMRVNALPNPVLTQTGGVLRTGTGFASYVWYLNGAVITGAATDTLRPAQSGNYTVKVTDNNGCSNTSSMFNFTYVGIGSPGHTGEALTLYPNPTTGMVYLQTTADVMGTDVYAMDGRCVLRFGRTTKLDVSGLPEGIYTLRLYGKDGVLLKMTKLNKLNP